MATSLPYELQPGPAVDLTTEVPLASGQSYVVCNIGPGHVRLREGGVAAPVDLSYYHPIPAGGQLGVSPDGDPIWVWAVGGPARLMATPEA